ncbi:MAG TPA: SprT-like domain-containing protein [Gemmatimonadaceae bacterium]|nr:SprT-like domain-containing protein [Gemmatimonadaceae bacterium]
MRILRWFTDRDQLTLDLLEERPRNGAELQTRLQRLGLGAEYRIRLTTNRTVVVSFGGGELRIHNSYLTAGEDVWKAIITFVHGRTRLARQDAKRKILEFPVFAAAERTPRIRRPERMDPADEPLARELLVQHGRLNEERFAGTLRQVPIRISRRMKSRLGHYSPRAEHAEPEIVISRRHIRRDGWPEALHTLLHEMVHQWQDEQGLAVDHGSTFRSKARAVGITPLASRAVA